MAQVELLDRDAAEREALHPLGALDLARRLPGLIVSAKEVAATVMHGMHDGIGFFGKLLFTLITSFDMFNPTI